MRGGGGGGVERGRFRPTSSWRSAVGAAGGVDFDDDADDDELDIGIDNNHEGHNNDDHNHCYVTVPIRPLIHPPARP